MTDAITVPVQHCERYYKWSYNEWTVKKMDLRLARDGELFVLRDKSKPGDVIYEVDSTESERNTTWLRPLDKTKHSRVMVSTKLLESIRARHKNGGKFVRGTEGWREATKQKIVNLLYGGKKVSEVCKELEISSGTPALWARKYPEWRKEFRAAKAWSRAIRQEKRHSYA